MTIVRLLQFVVCLSLVVPLAGETRVGEVPRVGVLLPGSPGPEYERRLDAVRRGLRDSGYIEGQNILVEYRWAEEKFDRLPTLVAELISLKGDVLVVDSTPAAQAAKNATNTIPIVLTVVGDPVGTGLVESLARPGGNITGMTLMTPDLSAKRLELLKEVVPKTARVAVLLNPDNRVHTLLWKEAQRAAPKLRVELRAAEVRRSADVEHSTVATPLTHHFWIAVLGGRRWARIVGSELPRLVSERGSLRGQDPSRRQAIRPTGRTAHQV